MEILIVEDDEANAKLFRQALATHYPPFESHIAESQEEALAFLRDAPNRYRLILLDKSLKDADGLELLKLLKKLYPEIPVGIVTGDADEGQRRRALKYEGAIFYLIKPPGNLHSTVLDAIDVYECQVKIWRQLVAMEVRAEVAGRKPKLLDKKSKIAIITAAIAGGIGAFIAGFWELIKSFFTRH